MMLYRKIDENQALTKKLEQCQMQHTMFLTKLLLQFEQHRSKPSADGPQLHNLIKSHLQSVDHMRTEQTK